MLRAVPAWLSAALLLGVAGCGGGGTVRPVTLVGPQWTAVSIIRSNGTQAAIDASVTKPSLRITDGAATFFTGCNNGATTVKVTAQSIQVSPLSYGKRRCHGATARTQAAFVDTLGANPSYSFTGRQLSLRTANGGMVFAER